MNAKRLKRSLRRIVGPNAFIDDPAGLASYSYDSSLQTAKPDFALFPQTTGQVAEIVKRLCRENIPYVARGAGTNLSGGSIPLKGGAVIALTRMKNIISVEPENLCARVEPGVTNLELQEALAECGFFFAPDPASQRVATLGGNVAENSGGPHCLKYGVTTNHILGLKLVAPDGDIIELGGESLNGCGPDALGLFVGSEGTLGIATEITCHIMPLPESTKTMLAVYDSVEDAGRTVSDIIAAGILPATLEMMDKLMIRAVEEAFQSGYPTDAESVLIIEIDGVKEGLEETAAEIEKICHSNGAREMRTARNEHERDQLWAGRRGAFGAAARLFPNYSVSDATVPRTELPEALRKVGEIGRKYDLEIGNVFHAGDGNLHPLVFFDIQNKEQLERVHRAGKEIMEVCVEAGGTITGEHGIGAEKIKAMPLIFGNAEMKLMREIKHALDPADLCNPKKILPEPAPEEEFSEIPVIKFEDVPPLSSEEFQGKPVYAPTNSTELAAIVQSLGKENKTFAPVGEGALFPGLPCQRDPDSFIRTTAMNRIIEHDAANMTVTAEAGISLGKLRSKLDESAQFLPLDAPSDSTLGAIVAAALPGPRRHIYGAVRDLALGLKFVDACGNVISAGGKTMKNVAGYDFGKLLVGSWGCLGIITEITFRILPMPKARAAFVATFDSARSAYGATAGLVDSRLNPSIVTLLNGQAESYIADKFEPTLIDKRFALIVGAEGFAAAIERQLTELEQVCRNYSGKISERINGEEYGALLDSIAGACCSGDNLSPIMSIRISAPRSRTYSILEHLEKMQVELGVAQIGVANAASGTIYSHILPSDHGARKGAAKKIIESIQNNFRRANIVVFHADESNRKSLPLVAGNRTPQSWLKAIKSCLVPNDLMNPGLPLW